MDYRFGSPLDIPITSPALHSPANMPAASPASNVIAASPYHPHGEQSTAEGLLLLYGDESHFCLTYVSHYITIVFLPTARFGHLLLYHILMCTYMPYRCVSRQRLGSLFRNGSVSVM